MVMALTSFAVITSTCPLGSAHSPSWDACSWATITNTNCQLFDLKLQLLQLIHYRCKYLELQRLSQATSHQLLLWHFFFLYHRCFDLYARQSVLGINTMKTYCVSFIFDIFGHHLYWARIYCGHILGLAILGHSGPLWAIVCHLGQFGLFGLFWAIVNKIQKCLFYGHPNFFTNRRYLPQRPSGDDVPGKKMNVPENESCPSQKVGN